MKFMVWLAALISWFALPCLTQNQKELLQPSPIINNMQHFRFKTRKVGNKNITVLSFKYDPERGRRSILVPDAEGLLRPFPLTHRLRHHHRFLPPFEDEERFAMNDTLNWAAAPYQRQSHRQETALIKGQTKDMIANEGRQQSGLFADSSDKRKEQRLESASLILREKKRGKKRRKAKKGGEKKKRRKNNKNSKKNKKKKPRHKMLGQEACQYKALKKCAKKLRLLPKKRVKDLSDFEKCDQRKEFLECVERRRDHKPCKQRSVARGNLPSLRGWIKSLFWTSSSCLLNESMKGR